MSSVDSNSIQFHGLVVDDPNGNCWIARRRHIEEMCITNSNTFDFDIIPEPPSKQDQCQRNNRIYAFFKSTNECSIVIIKSNFQFREPHTTNMISFSLPPQSFFYIPFAIRRIQLSWKILQFVLIYVSHYQRRITFNFVFDESINWFQAVFQMCRSFFRANHSKSV